MTSPSLAVGFRGGPCAGRRTEVTRRPAALVRVQGHDVGAYVLDDSGRVYVWHLPALDAVAAPVAVPRQRARRR